MPGTPFPNPEPVVSINILSWNRRDELRTTLARLSLVEYPKEKIELIVVDNSSTDGSAEMVAGEFPDVKLFRMPKNFGISGWNWGFANARGRYILVLDDDAHVEKDAIQKMVEHFESDDKLGIVAFKIYSGDGGKCITGEWPNEIPTFWGCAAGISSALLSRVGYYDEHLFIYGFEIEFVMKAVDAGFEAKYFDDCIAYHRVSALNRTKKRFIYFNTRNSLWRILKYYPLRHIVPGLLLKFGTFLKAALETSSMDAFLKGLLAGFLGSLNAMRQRSPLDVADFRRLQSRLLSKARTISWWDAFKKRYSYL